MESMIKIDTGVSKKAMEEVAEVAIALFSAANNHSVSQKNLGLALKLLGKSIQTGPVSIEHCNLTTTILDGNDAPASVSLTPTLAGLEKPTHDGEMYKAKDMEFEALQYTGDNQDEVMAFLDDHSGPDGVSFLMGDDIHFESPKGKLMATKGDYIVKTDVDRYLYSKDCFAAFFSEVIPE